MTLRQRIILSIGILLLTLGTTLAQEATQEPTLLRDTPPPSADAVQFELVASGFFRPVYVTHANDDSNRLFVLEQGGKIIIVDNGFVGNQPFLDISSLLTWDVNADGGTGYTERGLLGLAFHPEYVDNGQFFVFYTDTEGATVVARYQVSTDPHIADASSAEIILKVSQPYANHNGGHIDFGPDGYLYIALGDGGAANDPLGAGQNKDILLGSILRIDVDSDSPYAIPADNPFVDSVAPEVWAYGVRNPWRISFDRASGDMYFGDVGQNLWEEINFQPADSMGGENYGWNAYEASQVFNGGVPAEETVFPIAEYNHDLGCSITSGYIYRGETLPDFDGVFFYGDWCTGNVWASYRDVSGTWQSSLFTQTAFQIAAFGEDEAGELYIVDYSGDLYRIVPA